jgi:hypothetical protein
LLVFLKDVEKIEVGLKCTKKYITWKPTYVADNMSLNFLGMRKIFSEGHRENGNACRDKYIFPPGNIAAYKVIKSIRQSQIGHRWSSIILRKGWDLHAG